MFSTSNHHPHDGRLHQEQHHQQPQFDGYAPHPQLPQHQHQQPQLPPAHPQSYDMGSYSAFSPEQQQHHHHHFSQQGPARDSTVGPSRSSVSGPSHRRDYSAGGGGSGGIGASGSGGGRTSATNSYAVGGGVSSGRAAGGPYARPMEPVPLQANGLGGPSTHTVKASSTTSEFTKRKNWSQHIIDEIQDFMHVLSPSGDFMFVSPSINDLAGWTPEELVGRSIDELVHPEDVEGYRRDFTASLTEGQDLTLYCRFKTKDERYLLFEVTGHPYYAEFNGQQNCKCFFAMGRPYPSKNQAMLDSFLELKFENERLRQELQVLYRDIEGSGDDAKSGPGFTNLYGGPPDLIRSGSFDRRTSEGVIDPVTGLVQAGGLLPSSSNTYGALGIGISTSGSSKGDGHEKKKKKPRAEEGEFVCRDCGTVDSPEWRKGPEGPKSLCNACGLRYAKLTSKAAKQAKADKK
ncbi:hypothetical protein BCR35DRAFT_309265 [Leucosporidium creatinivorum]|uniref:Uncharacterized protein n=1 Tax=Leucosporidium creatinivorum TaxID=106004 RepID=A0A1Y2DJJ8_9BASI|nr:hypothetical protein BCR35DRAFT_309265 [Leucosporidium creatinivorum]